MLNTYRSFPIISISDDHYAIVINQKQYYQTKILTKQNSIIIKKQFIDNLKQKPQDKRTYISDETPSGSIHIDPSNINLIKQLGSIGISARYIGTPDQNGVIEHPQFITWNLVSQQHLLDKNCRLGNTCKSNINGKYMYEVIDYYPSNDGSCGYINSFETEQQAKQCARRGYNRKIRKIYIDY